MEQVDATAQSVLQKLQPADAEDSVGRSLFYSHCLHLYCRRQVDLLINRAIAGEFGVYGQETIERGVSDWDIGIATKLLTGISIHMVGLDTCSENGPEWLVEFLFEAMRESDEVFPEPPVSDILETHGSWKPEKMAGDVATHACHTLGFAADSDQAIAVLQQFLIGSGPLRTELLVFALSQPFDALRLHLQQFGQ